jgi:hypothetical protein
MMTQILNGGKKFSIRRAAGREADAEAMELKKNIFGNFRSLWVLALSLLVAVSPVYLHFNNLLEIDVFSPTPAFELLDPDDSMADQKKQVVLFTPSLAAEASLFCFFRTQPSPANVLPEFLLVPLFSPLRC